MVIITTKISYSDYIFLKELKETKDEDLTDNEFKVMVLEQFFCSELYDEMIQEGICPNCGSELESKLVDYEPYEFWGSTVHEPVYIFACKECEKTYDED